jgi:hypothetical protein
LQESWLLEFCKTVFNSANFSNERSRLARGEAAAGSSRPVAGLFRD